MKNLKDYIVEGWNPVKKVQPKTKDELQKLIEDTIKLQGNNANLNFIDTSKITDMSFLFYPKSLRNFNGDISKWDVSNVTNMEWMFRNSKFNGDIHRWNVSNVKYMGNMFCKSKFNGDISDWDVSNVIDMNSMFADTLFNGDIADWDVSNIRNMIKMFFNAKKFNQDLSNWEFHTEKLYVANMFDGCSIKDDYIPFGYVKGDDVIYN